MVEAQKAQPMRQPTWEEMHTVLPYWYRMSTDSTQLPSESFHKYFTVPSREETCLRSTVGGHRRQISASLARRALGRSVISSKERTPLPSH